NLRLRPTLLDMPPGTRIVSHAFSMQEWEPDQTSAAGTAYLWIVPAKVAGDWDVKGLAGAAPGKLTLHQSFQRVGGTLMVAGVSQPLLGAQLSADKLSFSFLGADKVMQTITATVTAGNLSGMHTVNGSNNAIEATRL
ncbi:MAG: Release factor glutamine methyltransferase, partial [Pseudomonadota bacterium]